MWSSPQKILSRDARLSKSRVSTVAPCHSASIEVDNHENEISMWSSPQKIFRDARLSKVGLSTVAAWHSPLLGLSTVACDRPSKRFSPPWRSPLKKVGLPDSRPETKNQKNKYVIVSKIFLRDAHLSKVGLSTVAPELASIEVDNHEKWNKYVIVPQKFFPWRSPSQKVGLWQSPRDTRLYWSW